MVFRLTKYIQTSSKVLRTAAADRTYSLQYVVRRIPNSPKNPSVQIASIVMYGHDNSDGSIKPE